MATRFRRMLTLVLIGCTAAGCAEESQEAPDAGGVPTEPAATESTTWPRFRGPEGNGIAANSAPTTWSPETVAWGADLPGRGFSSPVTDGTQVWVTSAVETPLAESEIARRLEGRPYAEYQTTAAEVSLRAVCVDLDDGTIAHDIEVFRVAEPLPIHFDNSYATPTPVLDGGRVYVHFGSLGTAALDAATGDILWRRDDIVVEHLNGPGSSPIVWNDRLVMHFDGTDRQFILALDAHTGETRWETPRSAVYHLVEERKSYTTPQVVDGKLISVGSGHLFAYDAAGNELWHRPFARGFSGVASTCFGGGLIFACSGALDRELVAVRPDDGTPVWSYGRNIPSSGTPVYHGGWVFLTDEIGVVTCLNASDGSEAWKQRVGGAFAASPIVCGDRLYLLAEDGTCTVARAAGKFELIAKNQLPGLYRATPAAVNGVLLMRSESRIWCVR